MHDLYANQERRTTKKNSNQIPDKKGQLVTRFPTESRDVEGVAVDADHPDYKVPSICGAPGCAKFSDHAHHLFSRGLMGGAHTWIRLPDGTETGNLVPLCYHHHEKVTNNEIHIMYENGSYIWDDGYKLLPMSWQPPRKPVYVDPRELARSKLTVELPDPNKRLHLPRKESGPPPEEQTTETEKPVCPSCGRSLPKPKLDTPSEEKKVRKTWAIAVPWTVEEDGADVLDALLEAAQEKMDAAGLDWGQGHKVKYYILATALGLFVQQADVILSDS